MHVYIINIKLKDFVNFDILLHNNIPKYPEILNNKIDLTVSKNLDSHFLFGKKGDIFNKLFQKEISLIEEIVKIGMAKNKYLLSDEHDILCYFWHLPGYGNYIVYYFNLLDGLDVKIYYREALNYNFLHLLEKGDISNKNRRNRSKTLLLNL